MLHLSPWASPSPLPPVQAMFDARCGESGLLRRAEAGQMLLELNLRGGEALLGGAGALMDWPTFFMHYVAAAGVAAAVAGGGGDAAGGGTGTGTGSGSGARVGAGAAAEATASVWVPTVVGTWTEVGATQCAVLLQVRPI